MTKFTHFNAQGHAQMVDISHKRDTVRTARAHTSIHVNQFIYDQIVNKKNKKGDVIAVAQVAGIMAAKQTATLIPMCHHIQLTGVDITFDWDVTVPEKSYELTIQTVVKTNGPTGVEMEALVATSVTALTIYDMCKSAGKDLIIGQTMLLSKTGGENGDFNRNEVKD